MLETIGFLELNSIAKGVEAADLILKTAEVDLIFAKAGCPGKYYILFTGEVAAVKASLDAGVAIGGFNFMYVFTKDFWDKKGRERRARTLEVLKTYGDSTTVLIPKPVLQFITH